MFEVKLGVTFLIILAISLIAGLMYAGEGIERFFVFLALSSGVGFIVCLLTYVWSL